MGEYEYSNGADGSCVVCGADTDEEWHEFCSDCYAEDQGWHRPDRAALAQQHEDRQRATSLQLQERLSELENRIVRLEQHDRIQRAA